MTISNWRAQARLADATDLAAEWTNSALLRIQEEPFDDNRQLWRVIYNTCIDGDRKSADVYLAKITRPYEHISGRIAIAEFLIRNNGRKTAKSYLADAMTELENTTDQELNIEIEHNERGYLLQELAKLHHQLNDDSSAGKLIQQAAQLVPDDDMSLWSLASAQIEVGRFQEAYATIHRISRDIDNEFQENLRLSALVELAAAYAKHEAALQRR